MKIQFIGALALLATSLFSCQKDKENPTILITSPTNHGTYEAGDHIEAKATFSDDQGLKSFHVHIGDEEGGHYHGWDFEDEGTIEGTEYEWDGHTMVPDSLPMMLWMHFEVEDQEGKVSNDKIMMHF